MMGDVSDKYRMVLSHSFLLYANKTAHFPTQNLLSDAEFLEDVSKDFIRGDLGAGDFSKLVEGKAKIFGKKVAGELVLHAIENAL